MLGATVAASLPSTGRGFSLNAGVDVQLDGSSSFLLIAVAICVIVLAADVSREESLLRRGLRWLQALRLECSSGPSEVRTLGRAMSESSTQRPSSGRTSGRKTREPTVGAPCPTAAPKELAASTKIPPHGLTAEEADFVDEMVDKEVRTGQLERGSSSEQSAGPPVHSDQNVTWEIIGSDDSERPRAPPIHVAEHPEEVVRNVIGAMGRQDAEKVRQFLALSKEILMAMCRERGAPSSGANLCRAMELTAAGASPGDPTSTMTETLKRQVSDLFPPAERHEIEDLCKEVGKPALKTVCEERGMHNSCTKTGLAVCIVLNKSRQPLYSCSVVDLSLIHI